MWNAFACSLILMQAGAPEAPLTPADAISQAHADLVKYPLESRVHIRYLSLYNIPAIERPKAIQVLSGHVNGLSRESDLTPVGIVPGTSGALVRVNILDYRWKKEVWELLRDPYFNVIVKADTQEDFAGGVWSGDGKTYEKGSFKYTKRSVTRAIAPWLTETEDAKKKLVDVVTWTGSGSPVARADWFFNQTAAAVERNPNYYDFLGVKDEKTYQELIGFDAKKERRKFELREAVADSGVTLQPRAIVRETAEDGGYWKSFDFKRATDKKNPLRVLGRDIEAEYDATEQYGLLPNGLWTTGLFDKAGKRQDTAPDFIASDHASKSNDKRVHVNVSCIRCHSNGGLQAIEGWARNLVSPPLDLKSPDYQKARDLRQQYFRKLEPFLKRDREAYEENIKEVTDFDSKAYSLAYGEFWERYEDGKIDLERAAAELGVTTIKLKTSIATQLRQDRGDTVLSVLVLANPRINRIPIRVWEEIFPEANLLIRGFSQ